MGKNSEVFLKIRYAWTLILPLAMFAMYISIFYNVRSKRLSTSDQSRIKGYKANNSMRTGRHEQSMLIQAALVCVDVKVCLYQPTFLSSLWKKGKEVSASNEESDEDHDADDEDHVKEHEGHAIEDDEYITKGEFVESDGK
ncbi:ABC transporter G family member [Dirofilaria immitis]